MPHIPTRDEAIALLEEHIDNENLRNHCRAVEAVMRDQARRLGEDEEQWGIIGLVHDLDWQRFPEEHCQRTKAILDERDWPEEYVRAVMSHGWEICTDVEPLSPLEKTLYALDELTGFVTACALVRPSRSVRDLERKSVMKKWKQKGFAAGVDRTVIERGATLLERPLGELVDETIVAMRSIADEIGL